jgi:hypothetical protein
MSAARFLPLFSLVAIPAPLHAAEEDGNVWLGQFVTINADEKVFVRLEAQERFTDDAERLGQLLLRALVARRIGAGAHIGAGYAYVLTDPVGPAKLNEHRFYQELGVRLMSTEGGVTLDSRTRLEQRTFKGRGGTDWRLREWVQLRVPVGTKAKLSFYTEPFVDLSSGPVQRGGISVWRNFAGVMIPLAKGVELVPGYLNQRVFRDGPDRIDHTANVNLFMTF